MYNARFILWPPSLYSPIRKKSLYRETGTAKGEGGGEGETGTAKGEGGGEGGDLSRATVPLALHSARRVDKSPYPRQQTKSNQ